MNKSGLSSDWTPTQFWQYTLLSEPYITATIHLPNQKRIEPIAWPRQYMYCEPPYPSLLHRRSSTLILWGERSLDIDYYPYPYKLKYAWYNMPHHFHSSFHELAAFADIPRAGPRLRVKSWKAPPLPLNIPFVLSAEMEQAVRTATSALSVVTSRANTTPLWPSSAPNLHEKKGSVLIPTKVDDM